MATLYYYSVDFESTEWTELSNWWLDSAYTVPATALPTSADDVVVHWYVGSNAGSTPTVANLLVDNNSIEIPMIVTGMATYLGEGPLFGDLTGNATFDDIYQLIATVTGNATFNGNSFNGGTVTGNATFNDSSNNNGIVGGDATFNDSTYNAFVATIGGDATLNDNAVNQGTVEGDATFNGNAYNSEIINGNATFNDSSYNISAVYGDSTFNDTSNENGTTFGVAVFNDFARMETDFNSADMVFNDNSYMADDSSTSGSVTFRGHSYNKNNIGGTVTVELTSGINGSSILGVI